MSTALSRELLSNGRCGRCAEQVSRTAILRRGVCPECASELDTNGVVLDELDERSVLWRLTGYVAVAAASFVAGAVPLLQVLVQVVALFVLHVVVLRGSLSWLPPARRILTRITTKLLAAAVAAVALLVNVAIAPFLGVSAVVLGLVGPVLTAVYVEGSLYIIRKRMRWEAEGRPLRPVEWAIPAALFAALIAAVALTAGIAMAVVHALASVDIPTVSELSNLLLEYAK